MALELKKEEMITLFTASIDNASALFDSAQHIAFSEDQHAFPSLGLAELALEELGKSYTLLCYLSRHQYLRWSTFWKEWRNHDIKAHRGFFYEFFCTTRVKINQADFNNFDLLPRGRFSREKEASFYVDISSKNRKIHIPAIEINKAECINRVISLMGLLNAAYHVKDLKYSDSSEYFKNAISDYAFITISQEIYQQDVKQTLANLKTDNKDYNYALECIWKIFDPNKGFDVV